MFEAERNDAVSVAMGIQPFDFAWRLAPGEQFASPELVGGYSEDGLGGAARLLHALRRDASSCRSSQRERLRPVLYNSWEATHFDVRAEQQLELARRAAAMGVELFVVDDGWFGARDNDRAGLGDWTVNTDKLPGGLQPADRRGARPGHAVRHLGRARDGQSGQRPVSRPSGLGVPRRRARADVWSQPAGAELRPPGRSGRRSMRSSSAC